MGLADRQPAIATITAVEVVGLVVWLSLVRDVVTVEITAFATSPSPAHLGLAVLFVALLIEHVLTDATVAGFGVRSFSPATVFVTLTETALWAGWLVVAEAVGGVGGVLVAGVVLAVLLVPQHTVEDNALRGRGLFSRLLDVRTLSFSVVEAFAATVWLAVVFEPALIDAAGLVVDLHPVLAGAGALFAFLFVEHNLALRFARRSSDRPAERPEPTVPQ